MQPLSLLELLQSTELKMYLAADILTCNCRSSTDHSHINGACVALGDDRARRADSDSLWEPVL